MLNNITAPVIAKKLYVVLIEEEGYEFTSPSSFFHLVSIHLSALTRTWLTFKR
jgi:hypothetical protein